MHMLFVIIGGALLLTVFCLFGRVWGVDMAALAPAAKAFATRTIARSSAPWPPLIGWTSQMAGFWQSRFDDLEDLLKRMDQ